MAIEHERLEATKIRSALVKMMDIDKICMDAASNLGPDFELNLDLTLEIVEQIGSTNEALSERARQHEIHALVLMAEQQTAGKGRQGRPWVSPFARNVYLTIAWQFPGLSNDLVGLSLALGCAIAEGLEREVGVYLQLKWPNDLYANERKVGGILLDLVASPSGAITVLVGVGINVAMPPEAEVDIDQPFTDLTVVAGRQISRHAVAAVVIAASALVLSNWSKDGFCVWREAWMKRDLMKDRNVTVSGVHTFNGIARGVNAEGCLLVESQAGIQTVWSGEASLRLRSLPER